MKFPTLKILNKHRSFEYGTFDVPEPTDLSIRVITLRMPSQVHKALSAAAKESGLSINEYLLRLACCNALSALKAVEPFVSDERVFDPKDQEHLDKAKELVLEAFSIFTKGIPNASLYTN